MYRYGSESAKAYNLLNLIKPEYAKAHNERDIHIHDLDYYALTLNCLFIPLAKILKGGTDTGNGYIREPNGINSAAAQTAVIIQCNQNQMYGGQAIANVDFDLAPYVEKTYRKNLYKEILTYYKYHENKELTEEEKKQIKLYCDKQNM